MPSVSVIIPTYNRADMLDEALASVFAQTYHDFEVIVVDDGSTDHTGAVIGKFARVRYIWQGNSGRSRARNTGLREARGKYIAFLDDDDLWFPQKLKLQTALLEKNESVDLVYSPLVCFGDGSAVRWILNKLPPPRDAFIEHILMGNCIGNPSAVMIRKKSLDRVGYFDPSVEPCEDWELLIRMTFQNARFEFITEPLAQYRIHCDNTDLTRIHAGYVAVLEKVFSAPWTPESLKARRRYFISRRWATSGRQWYDLSLFGKARAAWFEALKLDPSSVSRDIWYLAARSVCGTRSLQIARHVRRLLRSIGVSPAKG
jgi:glycosyltransferase involved in cell wall biosynthesis